MYPCILTFTDLLYFVCLLLYFTLLYLDLLFISTGGDRVVESLGRVYACHYPNKPLETARERGEKVSAPRSVGEAGCLFQR
jgi:hypothetical protein